MDLLKELSAQKPGKSRRGKGNREFLALKEEIQKAMIGGYTVRDIWEYLHDQEMISITYESFSNYTRKYGLRAMAMQMRMPQNPAVKSREKEGIIPSEAPKETPRDDESNAGKPAGFQHDPMPHKKRLI